MRETDSRTICSCCGHDAPAQKCGYCGFLNTFTLSKDDEALIRERAASHRSDLIRSIRNLSVTGYRYGAEAMSAEASTRSVRICAGKDCDRKIFWSKQQFGQNLDPDSAKRPLEITYSVGGRKRTLTAMMELVPCEEYWRLGLEITDDLRLNVYLGMEKTHSKSGPHELELL
ncbi:MAG: hypothetical protein IJH75_02930 [Mogibacterium sp.]|nr:hypothetical protein [Mogibacterium sp.]